MMNTYVRAVLAVVLASGPGAALLSAAALCDHEVVLDSTGRLQPWTSYDNVLRYSQNFITNCPTTPTAFGNDPWYLVTSKLNADGTYMANQNCQGSHAYWATQTLSKYYAYSGDAAAIQPVRNILDRIMQYQTPAGAAWANCPITQDNSPDGQYTDTYSEPDKMAMVGSAYVGFYKLTGEQKYLNAAVGIANTLAQKVQPGTATTSPLPFRVQVGNGAATGSYTSDMVAPVRLFGDLMAVGQTGGGTYQAASSTLWNWVMAYPMKNNAWSGYYEDAPNNTANLNQQVPMETARYILQHPELDPNYKQDVPTLLNWVKQRFGQTERYGATSIREQDDCFYEMSSHTSRYASVEAKWYGTLANANDPGAAAAREEARASLALSTYSAYSKYSTNGNGINYVGVGYTNPWFVDSYFDYMDHFLDAMKDMPELAPSDSDHILSSTSVLSSVTYRPGDIFYTAFDPAGQEIMRLTFVPQMVFADGQLLDRSQWTFGEYRGVSDVLIINRLSALNIEISSVPEPTSLALLGTVVLSLVAWQLKRRPSLASHRSDILTVTNCH